MVAVVRASRSRQSVSFAFAAVQYAHGDSLG